MEKTRITALVSQKGGVGKSSASISIANYLAAVGKSVLMVDTDYNNSTTLYYLQDRYSMRNKGFANAERKRDICGNILPTRRENIDIIPSNTDIERLEIKENDSLLKLFEAEAEMLKIYDHIIIDTSQGYNSIVANAVKAADLILTPFRLSQFDMVGCSSLLNKIIEIGKYEAWWIFFNEVSRFALKRNSVQHQYISLCRKSFEHCLDIYVPQAALLPNSIDRDEKITQKNNEKLYSAVKRLAKIASGGELPFAEAF